MHGRIVARHRRHLHVETSERERVVCMARNRRLEALVGDDVLWQRDGHDMGVVIDVLPRSSVLTRVDSRGRREPVAANLTHLVIVAAPKPEPDWPLLDRYLAAGELMPAALTIVFNKRDLGAPPAELAVYRDIAYDVIEASSHTGLGLEALARRLAPERSAMLGQSGVGKSSLLNALLGVQAQLVGGLTDKGGHGKHTTTTAVSHALPTGGELVDTPGVRHYAPYIERTADLARGFREFRALLGQCRFANCRHGPEPGCAIKAAVDDGTISAQRYASYRRLAETLDGLRDLQRP